MTIKQDVLAEAKRQQTAGRRIMFLGNGTIVAVPGGLLNQVYATDVDLNVNVIFNASVPNYLDYPVWVELVNKKLQVTSAWDVYGNFVATRVGPHWWTHAFGPGGVDIVPISGDQWLPWIVQPATTTDFTINIYRTPIYTTSGWIAGGVETYDMTSLIPGSAGAIYVLMSVGTDGTINYTSGPTEATPADLTIADYPALPSGDKPLYLVMLYNGMIPPFQYNPALSNFIDVRHMQAGGGGGGVLPTFDPNVIVFTDDSGNLTDDTNFYYRNGLFIMGGSSVPVTNPQDMNIVGYNPAFTSWGYDSSNAPSFVAIRSLGDPSSPAAVTANTILARFRGRGWYDGTNQSLSTEVRMVADEDWDATHQGSRIELWGIPDGATAQQLITTIYGDGRIVSANDIEITDATKGIILKDTVTGTRYRISVTSGVVTAAAA